MISSPARRLLLCAALICSFAASALAQGIELKATGKTYYGTASTCSQPATINYDRVRDATPEWQTIRSEGVRRGTARYPLLVSEMNARIERASRKAAEDAGRDCVVGHDDIKNDNGLQVSDLTDDVVAKLESGDAAA